MVRRFSVTFSPTVPSPRVAPTDLNALLTDVFALCRDIFTAVELRPRFAPALPKVSVDPEQIRRVRDSTFLYLGWGSCCAVKVGRTDFSVDQVVDNIMAAMEAVVEHLPRKWKSVKGVQIKTEESVALPVFAQLDKINLVTKAAASVAGSDKAAAAKKATGKRKKAEPEEELDEDERRLLAAGGGSAGRSTKRRKAEKGPAAGAKKAKAAAAPKRKGRARKRA